MTDYKALLILRLFQDWRTDKDLRGITDCEFTAKELTEAIDHILNASPYQEFKHHYADCRNCKHWQFLYNCIEAGECKVGKCTYAPKGDNDDV